MNVDEALVYRFSVEVAWDGQPGAASFDAAVERHGLDGTLDLIAVCGYYTLLAMVLNAAQPELPSGTVPLSPLDVSRPA
jgi:4-carboxymuconolactone decarboxylase